MYKKQFQIKGRNRDATFEGLLSTIERRLEGHMPNNLVRKEDRLEFNGGILRLVGRWSMLCIRKI